MTRPHRRSTTPTIFEASHDDSLRAQPTREATGGCGSYRLQRYAPTSVWLAALLSTLGVLLCAVSGHRDPAYVDDGVIALNIIHGKGFALAFHGPEGPTAAHAPLQPFLLAALHAAFGVGATGVASVLLMRMLLQAATVVLTFLIARRLLPSSLAVASAIVVAVHPVLLWVAGDLGYLDNRMTVSLPVLLLAVLCCTRACENARPIHSLLAGLAIGLAAYAEAQMLLFALPAALILASYAADGRQAARRIAALVAGIILVVLPWTVRNSLVFGRFVPPRTSFGLMFWVGNNPDATGLWEDQEIMSDPDRLPAREGALTLGGHPRTFNFLPRLTLPPEVLDNLSHDDEVARDRVLLRTAFAYIWRHPARFLELTATRMLYVMAGRANESLEHPEEIAGRLIGTGIGNEAVLVTWWALRLYLLLSFVLTLVAAVWIRTPPALFIAAVMLTWLVVFGVSHCGYAIYRFTLEPFTLLGTITVVARAVTNRVSSQQHPYQSVHSQSARA